MAAILYDNAVVEQPIEGRMCIEIAINRAGAKPSIRMVFAEGYYLRNGEDMVLNSLGYPTWVVKGKTWERTVPLSDQSVMALIIASGMDFAKLDDDLVGIANDWFDANVFNPPAPEVVG